MKVYNYISMLLLGVVSLASCSQDDGIEGENMGTLQGFQISVSEDGFQAVNASGTRATENNYTTRFSEGDMIGIFAVKGENIVEDINNRQFTYQDGEWVLTDGEDAIEYKGSEFSKMNFYAYYPYDSKVTFEPANDDPFATYTNNWIVGADQSGDNYTKYDLMTSTGTVQGDRLKGAIAFTMQHRMAMAVIQMPEKVYTFTNTDVTLEDYKLPVTVGSFTIDNVEASPYYQASTGTYRFLVKPNTAFSIKGTYTGAQEMDYAANGTLESGTAKKYVIEDTNKNSHLLAVGDYYCADGSIVSKDVETAPDNVIGIIYHVGNPQPSITTPTAYTETNDALRRDYPSCTHGLVLATTYPSVGGTQTAAFSTNRDVFFGGWYSTDEDWSDKFVACTTYNTSIAAYLGYNNTVLMTMSPNTLVCDKAVSYVEAYREAVSVPASASSWYLPSLYELDELVNVISTVQESIKNAGGEALAVGSRHWSSNERTGNTTVIYQHLLQATGAYLVDKYRNQGGAAGYFPMMLAF